MGIGIEPIWGMWNLVELRPFDTELATPLQSNAVRYMVGDMPSQARVGFEGSREILAMRSYAIGLLASLDRKGVKRHPREAMWWLLHEAFNDPDIIKAVLKWNRDRYFEDRGPQRVGGTRFFDYLSNVVKKQCQIPAPTDAESLANRNAELDKHGLGALLTAKSLTIEYDDGCDITKRRISDVQLSSRWPWWSYWLIRAPSFISVNAYCHLRSESRTFSAFRMRIVG